MNHLLNNRTSLTASLVLTGLASTGTSVIWNGLPFIAKRDYGFTESDNLGLYLLIGIVYVTGALTSGVCTRLLRPFASLRTVVTGLLLTVAIVCTLPLFTKSGWVIWTAGGVAGFCSAWLWPIVQSYLVAGRHGSEMRRAIGWWNLVWMMSVAGVMLAMAPLMDSHASMVIVGLGGINILAIFVLPWYPKNPAEHDEDPTKEKVPDGYRSLLRGARVLLPLSYVINGVLSPLLPYVLANISIEIFWQTPVAAIWMISRVVVTVLMWKSGKWHGKWSILWISAISMAIGFVCILAASEIVLLILGLIIFGGGMGVTYYAALYYAMSVGKARVEAGGKHEALIGSGYMVGPLIGLASIQLTPITAGSAFGAIIYVVLVIIALAIVALGVFWKKAR